MKLVIPKDAQKMQHAIFEEVQNKQEFQKCSES